MANCTLILVEGEGDVKFISDYISHIKPDVKVIAKTKNKFDIRNKDNEILIATIQSSGGWTKIKSLEQTIIKEREANNNVLIIFDADTVDNNGGFASRKKAIEGYNLQLNDIFLFPDNKDDGALEDLLENIINQTNKPIFDCWDGFENCLKECASEKIKKKLTIPAKKSKIYVYLEALLGKTKEEKERVKDPNRDYKETEHWNLDAEYLKPLKAFLERYLK